MSLFIAASLVDDASGGQHLEYQVNQPIVEDILRCYGEDSLPLQRLVRDTKCSYSRTKTDGGVELEKATRARRGLWALMRKLYDILRWRKLLLRALCT